MKLHRFTVRLATLTALLLICFCTTLSFGQGRSGRLSIQLDP
jgi:hypothetical protein